MGIGNITKLLPQWLLRGGRRCKTAANTLCGPGQGNGGIIFQIRSDNLQTDWQTGRTLPDGYHRRRQVRYGGQTGPDGNLGVVPFLPVYRYVTAEEIGIMVVGKGSAEHDGTEQYIIRLKEFIPHGLDAQAQLIDS
jgi:hypothetical protein